MYDRDHPRYPYKSHGQWLKALYGMIACAIIVAFNGVGLILQKPFYVLHFLGSYVGVQFSFYITPHPIDILTQC